jgi:hypothetical protein
MKVPAGSTIQVMIAQFIGMLVTAMVMAAEGDLVIGFTQLIKGYDPKMLEISPHATWSRWLFTALLQSTVGFFLLFDSFVLSMQSSTVIDLVLNLTALHFIQEIDEMAFTIAAESGLLGRRVQEDCEHVQNLTCFSTPQERKRIKKFRRCLILLMTAGLLIPYFFVVAWQSDGEFQLDDRSNASNIMSKTTSYTVSLLSIFCRPIHLPNFIHPVWGRIPPCDGLLLWIVSKSRKFHWRQMESWSEKSLH